MNRIRQSKSVWRVTAKAQFERLENRFLLSGNLELLKDINLVEAGNRPREMVGIGEQIFFTAHAPDTGRELWVTDHETGETRLVTDLRPGPESSIPGTLTAVGDTLYFRASAPESGFGLWKSDGTADGTSFVGEVIPFPLGLSGMIAVGETLYIGTLGEMRVGELWKIDGTENTTVRVRELTRQSNSVITEFAAIGSTLFFVAGGRSTFELWKSDGTEEGTVVIQDATGRPQQGGLTVVGEHLFYTATNREQTARELWITDANGAGPTRLAEFAPGLEGTTVRQLEQSGGLLYFVATHRDNRVELWKSDGTELGTVPIRQFLSAGNLVDVAGKLFFTVSDGGGYQLWKSDGTSEGTQLVKQLATFPSNGTNVEGTLFFTTDENSKDVLWKSDGTEAGTVVVHTFPQRSRPEELRSFGGELYFTVDGTNGLWRSDGTPTGTRRVTTVIGPRITQGSYLADIVTAGDRMFFRAMGNELWTSNGTESGTFEIVGFESLSVEVPTFVDGTFFFVVNSREVWTTDGTVAGTTFVDSVSRIHDSWITDVAAYNGSLHFLVHWNSRIWTSDANGIQPLENIAPDARFTGLKAIGGVLYATVNFRGNARLWATDGTLGGTQRLFLGESVDSLEAFAHMNGTTFFVANDGVSGIGLWKTDGTETGTSLVRGFGDAGKIRDLTTVGNRIFFTVLTPTHGWELWTSDGSSLNTNLVKDIVAGAEGSDPEFLTDVNGTLYFTASTPSAGRQLWKTDGTAAGTVTVTPATDDGNTREPINLVNVDGKLYYVLSQDCCTDFEIWAIDGTEAGTTLVHQFPNTDGEYAPPELYNFNGRLVAMATTEEYGREPWIRPIAGDVNRDGRLDAVDVDDLFDAIERGSNDAALDLDGNGAIDLEDVTFLVERLLNTHFGDANLDGQVDAQDINAVGRSWLRNGSWAAGDFDGDGWVGAADLEIVALNWLERPTSAASLRRAPLSVLMLKRYVPQDSRKNLRNGDIDKALVDLLHKDVEDPSWKDATRYRRQMLDRRGHR